MPYSTCFRHILSAVRNYPTRLHCVQMSDSSSVDTRGVQMYFVVEQAAASYLPDDFRMSQTVLDYLKHVRRTISPASPNGGQATPNATVQNSDDRDASSVLILLLNYSDHWHETNCGFVYYYNRPKCVCTNSVNAYSLFTLPWRAVNQNKYTPTNTGYCCARRGVPGVPPPRTREQSLSCCTRQLSRPSVTAWFNNDD